MPVIGATQLEPVNYLGQYLGGVEAARGMRRARMEEEAYVQAQEEKRAAAERDAQLRNFLSTADLSSAETQNALMRMPGGAAILKQFGEARESLGKGVKAETEGLAGRMQYFRQNIPFNPAAAANWLQNAYSDPMVGPELAKMGTLEEAVAGIPQEPAAYLAWMEGVSNLADKYVERRVPDAESMLPYTQTLTPEVEQQQMRLRTAQAPRSFTTIDARTIPETEYGKVVGKLAGEDDTAAYTAATSASQALNKVRQTQDLLARGQAVTGAFAEVQNNVNRVKKLVTGRPDQSVTDTELLDALLGQEVFSQIQALGIGARGLDTPAEREYLRKVVAGTITLDPQTLKRMTDIRADVMERAVTRFNERVESGEMDRFFRDSGKPKRTIPLPPKPKPPAAAPAPAAPGTKGKTARGTSYTVVPD
jgi:hypothetical protein